MGTQMRNSGPEAEEILRRLSGRYMNIEVARWDRTYEKYLGQIDKVEFLKDEPFIVRVVFSAVWRVTRDGQSRTDHFDPLFPAPFERMWIEEDRPGCIRVHNEPPFPRGGVYQAVTGTVYQTETRTDYPQFDIGETIYFETPPWKMAKEGES